MASPVSDYSKDSKDFLAEYNKKMVPRDPRLEFHQDVIADFGESYERAYMLWNTFYAEAYKDLSFYLSNQWSLEELSYLNNQRRSSYTYNNCRRGIDMVQGYQRKNRLASTVAPVESGSDETATILTDALQHVMTHSGGYNTISDAFKGALTTGMTMVSPWIDYRDDPVNGDIRFAMDDWNAVIMDPFMTKRDLSDCSFVSRRKFLSRTEVISLIPDKQDLIQSLPWGSRDDKFTYMPYARQWGMQKLMNYTEYWRTRWETKEVLVDMETGETTPWNGDRKRLQLFREIYPHIEVMRKPVRSVELGIIVEGELLYYGKDPFGLNDYPFVPFFCVWEPSYDLFTWKCQSLVRIMRDPQSELNKRRSSMIQSIDASLQTGWIAKTNSVSNPTSLYKSGHGQVIFIKPEANIADIQPIQRPSIDPSLFQLEGEFEKDVLQLAGITPELVGMSENDKVETAAALSKMRQGAALVTLQPIFDGLRESQKLLSEKVLKLMQLNYSPEKIKLLTKKEPTPEFYSKSFEKYNIVITEGLLTDSQKQTEFLQLNALRAMGVQVSDEELIDASDLHNKKQIKERIAAQNQAAKQQQQQQMEMAIKNQQVLTDAAESKALSDRSLAHEREAKIGLDAALNAERITRAEEERTSGVLNLLKAVKELEGIDLTNLQQKLDILREMAGQQEAQEQSIRSESQPTSLPA